MNYIVQRISLEQSILLVQKIPLEQSILQEVKSVAYVARDSVNKIKLCLMPVDCHCAKPNFNRLNC